MAFPQRERKVGNQCQAKKGWIFHHDCFLHFSMNTLTMQYSIMMKTMHFPAIDALPGVMQCKASECTMQELQLASRTDAIMQVVYLLLNAPLETQPAEINLSHFGMFLRTVQGAAKTMIACFK